MGLAKFLERLRRADGAHNFTCDVCGREVFDNERICGDCMPRLPWNLGIVCPFCGRRQREEGVCLECKERRPSADIARSLFTHEGEARRLIVRFKRGEKYLCRTLALLAAPFPSRWFPDADALTFVPMTARAEKERGYNQSRPLAEHLAPLCGLELLSPAKKQRETEPQKFLGRREREENLAGCFHVTDRKGVKGRRIVIVDDTLTTGATVSELAGALKRAGAEKVYALTMTSVERKDPFGKK